MRVDAEPFDLAGGQTGALCIHGFTGTPFEMRYLGDRLHRSGLTVAGPRLPGHGAAPPELDRTTWEDWYSAIERTFDDLHGRCTAVVVVGQSLGGLLALELAVRRGRDVSALAVLGTPLWLHRLGELALRVASLPGVHRLIPGVPKIGGSDVCDPVARADNPSAGTMPTRGMAQLRELMARVRSRLAQVVSPALVMHGARDHTVPAACAPALAARLGSESVHTVVFPRSYHLLSIDVERESVADNIARFFAAHGLAGAERGGTSQRAAHR